MPLGKHSSIYSLYALLLSPRFFKKASGILQSPPSVRPSVRLSVRLSVRPSVCPSRYLLLNRWTKFNQIWCVSCSHGKGVQRHIFFWPRPLGPWGGAKRSNIIKYHLISITKSISKIFKPNFVCLLTNERYKTYQTGFSFPCLGHAPGSDLGVPWGVEWSKKIFFSQIRPDLVCE